MIMKKFFAMILCIVLVLTLAACGDDNAGPSADGPLRVIYVGSKLGDNSTSDAINEGMLRAERELGIEYIFVEAPAEDPAKFPAVMAEAVDMKPGVIVCSAGSGMNEVAVTSAKINTGIKYIVLDAPVNQEGIDGMTNWVGAMAKQNEASFLVGYLAGLMTETNMISGTVGVEYPVLCDFIVGYIEGAKLSNPDIRVAVGVIGDFLDQARAKEIAISQANLGCDVLYAIAGPASFGILEGAKDSGVWAIGVDVDMAADFIGRDDEQANTIITSAIKDWGFMAFHAIERILNDEYIAWGTVEVFGINNGGVTFIQNDIYRRSVPADIQQRMDDLVARVKSGEIVVRSFFNDDGTSMSDEEYEALKNSVRIQ